MHPGAGGPCEDILHVQLIIRITACTMPHRRGAFFLAGGSMLGRNTSAQTLPELSDNMLLMQCLPPEMSEQIERPL
jgi:hypothetical protein